MSILDIIKRQYDVNNYEAMQIEMCMDDEDRRELIREYEEQQRNSI